MALKLIERINNFTSNISYLSYKLSKGNRIEIKKDGGKATITFYQNRVELVKRSFKSSQLPWLICNPLKLIELGVPNIAKPDIKALRRKVIETTNNPQQSFKMLLKMINLPESEEMSYFAMFFLFQKIAYKDFNNSTITESFNALKWIIADAIADKDAPKIAFINGYLIKLEKSTDIKSIESLYPGMTSTNLVGNFSHIIRFRDLIL